MIRLRTILTVAGTCGICVLLVGLASMLAPENPRSEYLDADTRSQLTVDYSGDADLPLTKLDAIKANIIEATAKDEEMLAQTELRITSPNQGGTSSRPLLTSFEPQPSKPPAASPTAVAGKAVPSPASVSTPSSASSRAGAVPTPAQDPYIVLPETACSLKFLARSVNSLTQTTILFVNQSSDVVNLFELNFFGSQEQRGSLNPGERRSVDTHVTHPWVVVDAGGDCTGLYDPVEQPGIVFID